MRASNLSPAGEIVRRHDLDRYFTALFAPARHRETLFTLYAFNHELARAREAVREPMAAMIRLQWWREVVEGARRRHEAATPLGEALDDGRLLAADLGGMIDAREAETERIESLADFQAYVEGTAGGVMVAAARAVGLREPERFRPAGAAYGVTGALRNVPALARHGRCVLPEDLLREAGSSGAGVAATGVVPPAVRQRLEDLARGWLDQLPAVPRDGLAAVLPVALARRALRGKPGGGRAAILKAVALGRV